MRRRSIGLPLYGRFLQGGKSTLVATKHPSSFLALLCGTRAAGHFSEVGVPLAAGSEIRQLGVGFTIVCSCGARLGWSTRVDATAEVFVSVALWTGMLIKRTAHGQEEPSEFIL